MRLSLDILQPNPLIESQSIDAFKQLLAVSGEVISRDLISEVRVVSHQDTKYFVKIYYESGKHLRKYIGRSRARAEYENLNVFSQLNIPIPKVIAFGELRQGLHRQACLVTEEIPNVKSLVDLYHAKDPVLKTKQWVANISKTVAEYTRRLHENNFVHVDLKWRNVLVDSDQQKVFFIDCPQGYWAKFRFKRGQIKDLACLDKVAKYAMSRTQRLRFYMNYLGIKQLSLKHKEQIKEIVTFFEGRE